MNDWGYSIKIIVNISFLPVRNASRSQMWHPYRLTKHVMSWPQCASNSLHSLLSLALLFSCSFRRNHAPDIQEGQRLPSRGLRSIKNFNYIIITWYEEQKIIHIGETCHNPAESHSCLPETIGTIRPGARVFFSRYEIPKLTVLRLVDVHQANYMKRTGCALWFHLPRGEDENYLLDSCPKDAGKYTSLVIIVDHICE